MKSYRMCAVWEILFLGYEGREGRVTLQLIIYNKDGGT